MRYQTVIPKKKTLFLPFIFSFTEQHSYYQPPHSEASNRKSLIACHCIVFVEKVNAVFCRKGSNTRLSFQARENTLQYRGIFPLLFLRIPLHFMKQCPERVGALSQSNDMLYIFLS